MPTTRGQARAANGGAPAVKPKPKTTPKKGGRKTSPKDAQTEQQVEAKVNDKRKAEEAADNGENGVEDNTKQTKLPKTTEGQDVKQAEKENGVSNSDEKESKIEANKKLVQEEEEGPKQGKATMEQPMENGTAQGNENHESKIDANKKKVEEEEKKDVEMAEAPKAAQPEDTKEHNPVQLNAIPTQLDPQQQQTPKKEVQTPIKQDEIKQEDATPAVDLSKSDIKINPATDQPETLKGTPNPVQEKGTFYWFFRNKIDVEEAESLNDVQRAYLVLRPIPHGQKPGEDSVKQEDINRVLIFPKKKFPSIGSHEREISFVDVTNASVSTIRDTVLASRTYSTKTKGDRTLAPCRPIASGVYSILHGTSDRSSHFAYILTTPTDITDVTTEFGLKERGSFVISVRNPEFATPAVGVPGGNNVNFPKELQDRFNGLRWVAADRDFLDVQGAQILWIGERGDVHVAGENGEQEGAAKEDLEGLEEEDKERVEHLKADDPVFEDLDLSAKNFAGLKVEWEE